MAAETNTDDGIVAINVTPFVDVVLVLLIIFMATANDIASAALTVELPRAAAGGEVVAESVALVLKDDGSLYLNGEPTTPELVAAYCREQSQKSPHIQAVIAADGRARHHQVVSVIDLIKRSGIDRFALNVDPNTTHHP